VLVGTGVRAIVLDDILATSSNGGPGAGVWWEHGLPEYTHYH